MDSSSRIVGGFLQLDTRSLAWPDLLSNEDSYLTVTSYCYLEVFWKQPNMGVYENVKIESTMKGQIFLLKKCLAKLYQSMEV